MRAQATAARAGDARPVNTRPPNFWSLDKTAPRGFHTLMLCMQICRTKSVRRVDEANLWIPGWEFLMHRPSESHALLDASESHALLERHEARSGILLEEQSGGTHERTFPSDALAEIDSEAHPYDSPRHCV